MLPHGAQAKHRPPPPHERAAAGSDAPAARGQRRRVGGSLALQPVTSACSDSPRLMRSGKVAVVNRDEGSLPVLARPRAVSPV